jgi:hypothetical protein
MATTKLPLALRRTPRRKIVEAAVTRCGGC